MYIKNYSKHPPPPKDMRFGLKTFSYREILKQYRMSYFQPETACPWWGEFTVNDGSRTFFCMSDLYFQQEVTYAFSARSTHFD